MSLVRRVMQTAPRESDYEYYSWQRRGFFRPLAGALGSAKGRDYLEWLVSSAGPPTVLDLGIALSPASYSLEEALEQADVALTFEPADGVPRLWSCMLRRLESPIFWN